jgi:hypothetical protein
MFRNVFAVRRRRAVIEVTVTGSTPPVAWFSMMDVVRDRRMWFGEDFGTGALWAAGHIGPIRRRIQIVGSLFDSARELIEETAGSDAVGIPFGCHHQLPPALSNSDLGGMKIAFTIPRFSSIGSTSSDSGIQSIAAQSGQRYPVNFAPVVIGSVCSFFAKIIADPQSGQSIASSSSISS